jgi:hypothetical protein
MSRCQHSSFPPSKKEGRVRMMPGIRCGLLLMLLLASLMVTLPGCNNSEYRTFTFKKGVNFSFEYPSHYKIEDVRAYEQEQVSGKVILYDKLSSKVSLFGFINITIIDASEKFPNARVVIEQIASNELKKDILERTTININGIPAELIVYSSKIGMIPEAPPKSWEIVRINRTVCFDYSGLIWVIIIESDEDKADQAKADFEHLLQTFKILD